MDWFESLFGFAERGQDVAAAVREDGEVLLCPNGRRLRRGALEMPTLAQLRRQPPPPGRLRLRQITGDVSALHADPAHAGALFQVASQFNLLEMISPQVSPGEGITGYAQDRTQGPAAAMACAAGTLHRNWLVPRPDGGKGQTADWQINCAEGLGAALGGADALWVMQNGYLMPRPGALDAIAVRIASADREALMGALCIGLMRRTEVTLPGAGHLVDQAYCSALPIGYSSAAGDWEPFARLMLDAAYEATLRAAQGQVFLTLLGGGVFGNPRGWILSAIERALRLAQVWALEVAIVSYGAPAADIDAMIARLR